jgi:Tfp pilus assembly protein PilX
VERDRGVALILALLILSFLSVIGGALLTNTTIDIWIGDNYKSATQSLYLAEAGIDEARELLRSSTGTPSELLSSAAGLDQRLVTGDDHPLIASQQLIDASGRASGLIEVWLRNDNADGITTVIDTNEVLTLVSFGQIATSRKTIEVTVRKSGFPQTDEDPRLKTVAGLEGLVKGIKSNATDNYTETTMGNFGGPNDYRVVVVDGRLDLGAGAGYGILLVRGELSIIGDTTWNGLILVIGQGTLHKNAAATVNGGLFVARTRAVDGSLLSVPEDVLFQITDALQIKAANRAFPYNPIAIREK